jgi:hypothetical protein
MMLRRNHRLIVWLLAFGLAAGARAETSISAAPEPSVPTVVVRTGEHPGYSRIVFDWLETVEYQVRREDGHVIVAFDRQATFDLSRLRPVRWIGSIVPEDPREASLVRLGVDEAARLRHLRVGPKVVVDVYATRRGPAAAKIPATAAATPADTAEPVAHADEVNERGSGLETAALGATTGSLARPGDFGPLARPGDFGPLAQPDPDSTAPASVSAASAPTRVLESATQPTLEPPAAAWETLRFAWGEPTAAAVFRRAGWIWIVFDRPSDQSARAAGSGGGTIRQLPHDRATILRFSAAADLDPVVERDGFAWIVRPGPSPAPLAEPIAPEIDMDPSVRLVLPAEGFGTPLAVADPEIGDDLMIVPLMPPGRGVAHAYDYPQFGLLRTAQGAVIVPRVDDLRVTSATEGLEITRADGLHVSPVPEVVRDRARLRASAHLTRVFDAASWPEELSGDAFVARERQLRKAVVVAPEVDRHAALLDVARFYLGHGLAAECLGALAQSADESRDVQETPRFRLLRGACRMLMNRPHEAGIDLSDASLDGVDEGALWRAALQAVRGDPKAAAGELLRTGSIALNYPFALRAPLTRLAVEAALAADNESAANNYLDVIRSEPRGGISRGQLALLEGGLRALEGDHDGALEKWTQAENSLDRSSRAGATLARIRAQLERDELAAKDAIELLETLRYAWRGGAFELDLLRQLARLYGDLGDHRQQLMTLRQAASSFAEYPQAAEVAAEMTAAFEKLYLGGGADALTPLSAIALFDEFRELTPAGDKGNEMMRRLADRLVAVDLLDRAALLLDDQIRHRLRGTEQAKVGARLALVYLLDQKPELTLKALEASATPDMPADLDRQRGHLKARAMADLQRFGEALLLLGDDETTDADLIRADVLWKTRDWKQANHVLARLALQAGARPGQSLEDTQARYVLNRAVALTLGGDEDGLARLRQDHGQAMDASPYADAFRLIASARIESATDVRAVIATDVREAEGFQTFLAVYRDRLRQDNLSAIN